MKNISEVPVVKFRELKEPYLIAEIGINHNGDLNIAKRLIDAAFACGWDCVKFQKREPEACIPESQKGMMRETPWGGMTYLDYRKRMEFGKREYDVINQYCKLKPIAWSASVWDIQSLNFIINYDIPFIKIPSAHMTNSELIRAAAMTKKPLLVSTGMSTLEEVDECVEFLNKLGADFALMHANSAYPAPEDEINLNIIKMLAERYRCPIGYSGHEYGLEASVLAVALGAIIVERHVTLDHRMWGTDHKASLEIEGMEKLVRRVKSIKTVLGSADKKVTQSEVPMRIKLRGNA